MQVILDINTIHKYDILHLHPTHPFQKMLWNPEEKKVLALASKQTSKGYYDM